MITRIEDAFALGDIDAEQARTQLRRAGLDPTEIEDRVAMNNPARLAARAEQRAAIDAFLAADRIFSDALIEHFGADAIVERYRCDTSHWPPKLRAVEEAFVAARQRWLGGGRVKQC